MRSIKQIKNLKGKTVLVRVDFNVPVENGRALDDFRIKKSLPTLKFLQKGGARLVLLSHLSKSNDTLAPVAKVVNKFIKIKFIGAITGAAVSSEVSKMKNGEIILLENLRNDKREQECDKTFALSLAKLGNIYVNEAFAVSHREDASLMLLPKLLPAYAGFQLEEEVKNLSQVVKNHKHPFLFIAGGAKFSTKIPLIRKYLKLADFIFVGGALLNDFLKAEGYEVGRSLTDGSSYDIKKFLKNKKILLPDDVLVESGNVLTNKKVSQVKKEERIIDIGREAVKLIEPYIKKSKLILWNGPLGIYEKNGSGATKKVLKLVAQSGAHSVIGGGDTVVLISEMKMEKKFSFISTGGGATLDFLAHGTLPAIKMLG
jgi:phosphoglycerate kinase